ncbi:MAG: S8 family serine peptidase, partial [Anaerolineae bacterium]
AIPYELPGTHLNYADAEALRTWLASGSGHQATISDAVAVVDNDYGDRMAVSSSRGPNDPVPSVIKPDVIAPGSDILAAYKTPEEYNMISGTSMSSPHAAGAAALLLSVHPGWTPAEVQAALVSTAESAGVVSHDWATPAGAFDRGGGRVNVSQAAEAGFVLDETPANFVNADPALDGDPSALNLASLGNAQCVGSCSWTRVLSSTWDSAVQWDVSHAADTGVSLTIEPTTFELAPGATQLLTITADVSGASADQWHFGEVVLTPSMSARNGTPAVARLPLAVKPTAGSLPNRIEIHTRRNAGSQLEEGLESIEITDLTIDAYGLVRGTLDQFLVQEIADPSGAEFPNVFFAGRGHFTEITVPGGSPRLVVEVVDTTSPDLDLLVFYDANDNGQPELTDLNGTECQSADAGSWERCDVASPTGGRWFAATINFDASTPGGTDAASLSYAAVDGDAGNLAAEGPSQVDAGAPYDLRVYWDTPTMVAGDRWYGLIELGSDPGHAGNIGRIPVDVIRHADDVTKSVSRQSISADGTYTLTYTIAVQPNITPEELVYSITDTIPAGMTYVPGSATASSGTVNVADNQLTWSGTPVPGYTYEVDTSWSNPACRAPGANSGAYLDLVSLQSNLVPDPSIDEDTLVFSVDFAGGAHNLFGQYYGEILNATATGFMYLEPATEGEEPWINDPIPTASDPNNLMAVYWRDLQIVYDGPANKGVTLVNATDSSGDPFAVIEYDDVEPYPTGSTSDHFDFELIAYYDPDPNRYEYIFAYDNLVGDVTTGTIGLEDLAGTFGVQYAYNDVTLSDGLAICFDLAQTRDQPATITYQVTVTDAGWPRTFTNEVDHQTDNPGSQVATTSVDVITARYKRYLPLILVNQ